LNRLSSAFADTGKSLQEFCKVRGELNMSKRKWGYMVVIRERDDVTEETKTIAAMEAVSISPFNLDAGNRLNISSLSESEQLAGSAGPMTMGVFIEKLGNVNVLSFKKITDQTSIDLQNAQIDQTVFSYATLGIISLSKVSPKSHGRERVVQMFLRADAYVDLMDVSVTFAWTKIQEKGKPAYDLITLECKKVEVNFNDK
jgi:hypothetical protein